MRIEYKNLTQSELKKVIGENMLDICYIEELLEMEHYKDSLKLLMKKEKLEYENRLLRAILKEFQEV